MERSQSRSLFPYAEDNASSRKIPVGKLLFLQIRGGYNTDASKSLAYLKAGDQSTLIKTLGSITAVAYANSQAEGANVFDSYMYRNTVDFTVDADDTEVEIGVTGTFDLKTSWCIVGKFQLLDMDTAPTSQDVTYLLTNSGFEYGSTEGWTLTGSPTFVTQSNTGFGNKAGKYYAQKWLASGTVTDATMSQTLSNLPDGKYTLSAYASYGGTGAYIQAGENKTEVAQTSGNTGAKYEVTADVTSDDGKSGTLTVSAGVANGTSNYVCFDRFALSYVSSTISDAAANEIIAEAKALYDSSMNATVLTTLKSAADNLNTNKTADNYEALQKAITAANTSISNYATAKTYLDAASSLDDAGKTNYAADATVSALQTAYNDGSLEAVTAEQITALDAALITAVKAQTTEGADMTLAIVNPSFETGNYNGWTTTKSNDTGAKSTSNNTYKMEGADGNYLFNTWSVGYEISQTITGLPTGKYTVSAVMGTDADKTFVLKMNSTEATAASVNKSTGVTVSGDVLVTNGTLTISAGTSNQYWYKVDNFKLTFVKAIKLDDFYTEINALVTKAEAITGDMSETASSTLNDAITAGKNAVNNKETDFDKLNTIISDLESSIAAANVSVAEYSRGAAINALITKESGSIDVTSAVVSDVFDGWSQSGNGTFHKNTWSSEGKSDGSGMTTPFVEDWLSSGKKLADNVLTFNTISGLKAGQYKVSLLTRVMNESAAVEYTGATLNINQTAIDLIADATKLTGKNGVYKTAEAVVTVEDKGSIAINIEIKSANFNWISFKDLKIVYLNDNVVLDETVDDALAADLTTNYPGATDITVSLTRNFTKDLNSTICLPYDVTPDANAGTFYTFAGVTEENGEYVVTMSENAATTLTANTPYLFKPAATGDVTFTGKIAKVADTYTPAKVESGNWTFAGSYNKVQWNEESVWGDYEAVYCYSMGANATGVNDGDFVKVKKPSTGFVSTPFRCMMKYKAAASEGESVKAREMNTIPSSMKVVLINADGTSTAIDAIDVETEFADGAWYTIDGRKLQGKPAVKGIYINGGQKVLIK